MLIEAVSRQSVILPLRNYVLLGVGDWGWATMQALAHTLGSSHPELVAANEWAHISPGGWCWFDWLPPVSIDTHRLVSVNGQHDAASAPENEQELPPEELRRDAEQVLAELFHGATSRDKIEQLRSLGYAALPDEQSILDIYVFGRADDPLLQNTLFDVIELLRRMRSPSLRFTLGLFLGIDSPQLMRLPQGLKQDMLGFIESLDSLLVQDAAGEKAREEGVGWCYLVDTVDGEGRSIGRSADTGSRGASGQLADVVAGFISFLIGSDTRESADYSALALSNLVGRNGLDRAVGYCSTFSCSAELLPVADIVHRSAWKLGTDMLAYIDLKRQPDTAVAQKLAQEFMVVRKLNASGIEERLTPDEADMRMHFSLNPAQLNGVPNEALVDRILSWDAHLARNVMGPLVARMSRRTQSIVESSTEWIKENTDQLVTQRRDGLPTARALCDTLTIQLKREQYLPNTIAQSATSGKGQRAPAAQRSGSGSYSTNGVRDMPEQAKLQARLQLVLGEYVGRKAMWLRYAFLALIETVLLANAWGYRRDTPAPTLGPLAGPAAELVYLLIIAVIVLFANALFCMVHIAYHEKRIADAKRRLIAAIEAKYGWAIKWNIGQFASQIYGELVTYLVDESAALDRWDRVACEAREALAGYLKHREVYAPLRLENPLMTYDEYSSRQPEYTPAQVEDLFGQWLWRKHKPQWRSWGRSELVRSVEGFAARQIEERTSSLSIEEYAEGRTDGHSLANLVGNMQQSTKVQMGIGNFITARSRYFLGVYNRELTQAKRWAKDSENTTFVSTRDPARIVYAPTVHGLPLRELQIWEALR